MNSTSTHRWSTAELDEQLSRPNDRAVDALGKLTGDILVLGAGGKMGPSLARMARRSLDATGQPRRVIAVSRFSDRRVNETLQATGVETIAGDLLDPEFVTSLPVCENVVFMAGMKFGTVGEQATTWATNAYLPGIVCRHFAESRIACLSTGNVYGLIDIDAGNGSREGDELNPVGEYAMSCVGRERIFEYFSRKAQTPISIIRLNYATELRYGVLVDLATKVFREESIPLDMGYFNVIWQRDACNMTLCSLAEVASPPAIFNVTGLAVHSTREVCEQFGELMGKPVHFTGSESETALLSDARQTCEVLGEPDTALSDMIAWTAEWVTHGGDSLNKPTHFEVRNGKF
jgi:nucleoside-diphosphate-sugar epimerase